MTYEGNTKKYVKARGDGVGLDKDYTGLDQIWFQGYNNSFLKLIIIIDKYIRSKGMTDKLLFLM